MAETDLCDEDSPANCEDEEMVLYKKNSLSVVTFTVVREEKDLEAPTKKGRSFKPDMAHQIFGEKELIFGYKHISVDLFYLHNSAKCYVDVKWSDKIAENDLHKADDVMKALNPWLPENYRTKKEEFIEDIRNEDHAKMFGEIIDSFQQGDHTYKITVCDPTNPEFQDFHQRFETYITWFIDGANFIDLTDSRWTIFYVYEESVDANTKQISRTPVAFCTVYKFYLYPDSTRPRISQFFVLPTHQRQGIGTKLYSTVFNYLKSLPEAQDITVEEPTPIFQKIRDFCDSLSVHKELEANQIDISTQNEKQINDHVRRFKICKRQAQRVFDILECMIAHKNGYQEYVRFTKSIKRRISNEIERATRGSKRVCNLERAGIVVEPVDKPNMINAEYNRYINSLEWPVNRLKKHLDNDK